MRFLGIRINGLGVLREFTADFDAEPGLLTAVAGDNGTGKTTMLELLLAGIYRQLPTRGTLAALAEGERNAILEVRVAHSLGELTMKHVIDGVANKASAAVVDSSGNVLTPSGKVREFDAFIAQHFPPLRLVLATQFAAQGAGGFIAAKPAERKGLLLRMLGVQLLENLHTKAGKRHAAAIATAASTRKSVQLNETTPGGDVAMAEQRLDRATAALTDANNGLAVLTDGRQRLLKQAQAFKAAELWDRETKRERDELRRIEQRSDQARAELRSLDSLLGERFTIEAAAARLNAVESDGRIAADDLGTARELLASIRAEVHTDERSRDAAIAQAEQLRASAALVDPRASERVQEERELVAEAESREAMVQDELDRLRAGHVLGIEERVGLLREGFKSVQETPDSGYRIATDALEADDSAVDLAEQLPKQISATEQQLRAFRKVTADHRPKLLAAEKALANSVAAQTAAEQLATLELTIDGYQQRIAAAGPDVAAAESAVSLSEGKVAELRRQYAEIRKVADRAKELAHATARGDVCRTTLEDGAAQAKECQDRLAALGPRPDAPETDPTMIDLPEAEAAIERMRGTVQNATVEVAAAKTHLQQSREKKTRQVELEAELQALEQTEANWSRMVADLGKKGLQASLVDTALPEIVAVTNDLLAEAFGPRFTLNMTTQTATASGKLTETLDVLVHDSKRGRQGAVESYSGGERSILAEGLSLALTTISCREAGVERPTIIRDEAGAALDEQRSRQWVAMLRRAGELVHASRVLFVSHNRECREMADAVIEMKDAA